MSGEAQLIIDGGCVKFHSLPLSVYLASNYPVGRPQPPISSNERNLSEQPEVQMQTLLKSAECDNAAYKTTTAAEDKLIENVSVSSMSIGRSKADDTDALQAKDHSIGLSGHLACNSNANDKEFSLTSSVQPEYHRDQHEVVCAYREPDTHCSGGLLLASSGGMLSVYS